MTSVAPSGPSVLVADDDDGILRMLRALVRSWGFEAVTATNGVQALEVLLGPNAPSVAIVDWMMPGLSGLDVVRGLEAVPAERRPRVLLLTARGGVADLAEALAAGADDYVSKPFDPVVLKARLEAMFRRTGEGGGAAFGLGTLVDGRYRLEERIGSGGMGAVFRATHTGLGTTVALKIVRTDRADLPQARARFEREARLAASISSPHVARVIDCGVTSTGHSYLVMEHLSGETLEQRLLARGPLEVAEAVEIVAGVAEGLEAAHRAGLVHRDVKPGNIFLARDGDLQTAKLIDFGLAKDVTPGAAPLTDHGEVIGTVGFMSPSQLLGEPITVDCDLWALAATAVAMLVGRSPFESDNPSLTIVNTLQGETPRPTALRPGLEPDLDVWAQVAFSRQPHERFISATELALAFSDAARGDLGFSFVDEHPTP